MDPTFGLEALFDIRIPQPFWRKPFNEHTPAQHGQRIVSAEWVRQSVTADMDNDAYQFQWYGSTDNLEDADGNIRYFESEAAAGAALRDTALVGARVLSSRKNPGQYYVKAQTGTFGAQGILSQHIYVDPALEMVIVRQGKKWDGGWDELFGGIAETLR